MPPLQQLLLDSFSLRGDDGHDDLLDGRGDGAEGAAERGVDDSSARSGGVGRGGSNDNADGGGGEHSAVATVSLHNVLPSGTYVGQMISERVCRRYACRIR